MKPFAEKATVLVLLTAFVALLYGETLPAKLQTQEKPGHLILQSQYTDLEVLINGEFIGRTSDTPFELEPGKYRIVVKRPTRSNWLDQDWTADVMITASDTIRIPVVFRRSYAVNSIPYGAKVYLDKELIGETPVYFKLDEDEVRRVHVEKTGFQTIEFEIGAASQQFYNLTLESTFARKKPSHIDEIEAEESALAPFPKSYLYATLGLTVLSGGLALYFRDRANGKFEQYRQTGNPDAIERLFNETREYDRYATASFVVFQVSFAASFYLALKSLNR